jgi:type IV pilus assembly protein PilX
MFFWALLLATWCSESAMKIKNIESQYKQTGATLAISLIILLLMTLIGVSGMKTNILEEKMVNNDRQYKVALHAAEFALREAENQIDAEAKYSNAVTTSSTDVGERGLYLASAASSGWWGGVDWDDADQVKASSSSTSERSLNYIIEQLPVPGSKKGSKEASTALKRNYYRVTSRAVVAGINARVMLQSTYKK